MRELQTRKKNWLRKLVSSVISDEEKFAELNGKIYCQIRPQMVETSPENWEQRRILDIQQDTHLSLTNRATHLCKCNYVADLTSIIKIRLKKNLIPLIRSFKVTQGHWNQHGSIRHL